MANIEVVSFCNLNCPYCFAKKHLVDSKSKSTDSIFISLDVFEKRLDFLDRSNINQIRLIGGEPTLHPNFPELIRRAKLRNKQIVIFSHGFIPKQALRSILELSPEDCAVLVNTNATKIAGEPTQSEKNRRAGTIMALGPRALLGYNIYSTKFEMNDLLELILKANCRRSIRVGLTHPILNAENHFLHPKKYRIVARKLVDFSKLAIAVGVKLEFDCGFVRCMFSKEDIEILEAANADIGWRCNPVVDISISGWALMCFPNAGLADIQIDRASEASQLRNEMNFKIEPYRVAGIYPECSTCLFKINIQCSGGGIENTIRRFRHTNFQLDVQMA